MIAKLLRLFVPLIVLSACTAVHPPGYGPMPTKSSLTPGEVIIVGAGQNVYGLAQKYNVPMRSIIALNDLTPPFVLRTGQRLTLPAKDQDSAPAPMASPLAPVDNALPTGSSSSDAVTSAPLDAPQTLPPAKDSALGAATLSAPLAIAPQQPPKRIETTVAEAPPSQIAAATTGTINKPQENQPAATSTTFIWPVQGPVVATFGSKDGVNNDGINISAPKGSPVVAASGGMVVYAGNEMKGFGNLVLIRHEGGWVTAYAHLDRMMVTKDTIVAPGDMVGTVGTTGGVSSPQLHFETRLEGKAVDPQGVIKKL